MIAEILTQDLCDSVCESETVCTQDGAGWMGDDLSLRRGC
jgi:hypothetical protein